MYIALFFFTPAKFTDAHLFVWMYVFFEKNKKNMPKHGIDLALLVSGVYVCVCVFRNFNCYKKENVF
jgi:hypothetical protein